MIKIRDMEPDGTVAREMALFRVNAAVENRAEIMQFAEIFGAKIVDVSRRSLTIEVTGTQDKIDSFERMVRPHGLIEMARTGEVAITKLAPGQLITVVVGSRRQPPVADLEIAARPRRRRRRRGGSSPRRSSSSPPIRLPIAFASALASDRWFCWEEPDAGFALAGVGTAPEVVCAGGDRFAEVPATGSRLHVEPGRAEPDGLPAGAGAGLGGWIRLRTRGRIGIEVVVAAARARCSQEVAGRSQPRADSYLTALGRSRACVDPERPSSA